MTEKLPILDGKSNNFLFYFKLAFCHTENLYFRDYIRIVSSFSSRSQNEGMTEKFHIIPKVFFKTRKLKTYSERENVIMVTPREYIKLYQILSCYYSQIEEIDIYLGIIRHLKHLTGRSILDMKRNGTYLSEDDIGKFEEKCLNRVRHRSDREKS